MRRHELKLDPECEEASKFVQNLWADPMTLASGVGDEIEEDFKLKHLKTCERCQEYTAANI